MRTCALRKVFQKLCMVSTIMGEVRVVSAVEGAKKESEYVLQKLR